MWLPKHLLIPRLKKNKHPLRAGITINDRNNFPVIDPENNLDMSVGGNTLLKTILIIQNGRLEDKHMDNVG